eukprot:CAMPEP_0119003394 /NCGR_PEP_ID=MMETSP1176-20130426/533_1 /TAXON_ID=265551 /ORGANISM="Synedropsis recta cf, Strain CCMP1620" /LENGTH=560 /DNA_ID=CAMNT_0006954993 /DNA_START=208 /DNA_END=1887 /DNA_ORIENTATION=+
MGKKGKKQKQQQAASAIRIRLADVSLNDNNDDSFRPPSGWAREVDEARFAAKQSPTASSYARLARAYVKLRLHAKCIQAVEKGLAFGPIIGVSQLQQDEPPEQEQLESYRRQAKRELAVKSEIDVRSTKELFQRCLSVEDDLNLDLLQCKHTSYKNSNYLQYSCLAGDVRLMEAIVAHGAAIDFPFLDHTPEIVAPTSWTALVPLCGTIAMYGQLGRAAGPQPTELKRVLDGQLDCAVRLVQLGANCDAVLTVPSNASAEQVTIFATLGLAGKTCRQLAKISKNAVLIDAMKELQEEQDKISKVHCRCGSRLPWTDCHSGQEYDACHHSEKNSDKANILYRYSPLAKCPCKLTSKGVVYFKCCWSETTRPTYQCDETGSLEKIVNMSLNTHAGQNVKEILIRRIMEAQENGEGPDAPVFPHLTNMTPQDMKLIAAQGIRKMGMASAAPDPRSKMRQWDAEIYAGVIERLDDVFHWNDLHWGIDKPELLLRTKEWNKALEQYCDDEHLTGSSRNAVMETYRASPLAVCGNAACTNVEKEVKEFQRCGQCRAIAYCTRECQK